MSERRQNGSVREQAQNWFDALRTHLSAGDSQSDIVKRLKQWATLEDMMADCPRLLPPLMVMAWQLRAEPSFSPLFQTTAGALASDTTTPLAPSGKSFDEVILIHLQGSLRVFCLDQEQRWLKAEKARNKPTGLATLPLLGPLVRKLTHQEDKDFLARYPQRGLYPVVKPHLFHPRQFALIETLAALPTRTAVILGDFIRGMVIDSGIRNLASLETAKCKFVTGLARLFAETVIGHAKAAAADGTRPGPPIQPAPVDANLAEIAGTALCHLTAEGLHLAKGALSVRDSARDVVSKMSVPLGYGVWRVFSNGETAGNVALCPAPLALVLTTDAMHVNPKTSEALNSIKSPLILGFVVNGMVAAVGEAQLAVWTSNPNCVGVWLRMANEINKQLAAHGESALPETAIADYCKGVVPSFEAVANDELEAAAPEEEAQAPAEQTA